MKERGITLIALVITIVILLVLAGITISTLAGENGLIARVQQAKQAQIESDMKEQLALALQDLQIEKLGEATLDDVTQEWIDGKIKNYDCTIKEDASISGKRIIMEKNGAICKFLIDENLNSTVIEEGESGAQLEYEAVSRDGENVNILVTIIDTENGLQQVEFPDGTILYCNGEKQVAKDYKVQLGVECVVKITSKGGQVKEEKILINDYYYAITKNLGEGISIDNNNIKASYNKPYQATITAGNEYKIVTITVTMGGKTLEIDTTTGVINIEKVTGNIEITATAKKLEIKTTTPIINTSPSATSSLKPKTQKQGTTLYINFSATIEGVSCTIEPAVPYIVKNNGKYKFTLTGVYENKTISKEIDVIVDQYELKREFVSYDAGEWTEGEINVLKTNKLYDLNAIYNRNNKFKLNDDSGLTFTFGGFTYKGDTENENKEGVKTSRNESVTANSALGTPLYNGWQILESKYENGKTYITKIMHAGTPENFVYSVVNEADNNGYRAEYLLSNGERCTEYSTLVDGTLINPRNWDMYRDKELDEKGYIKEVHCMTYDEAFAITGSTGCSDSRDTGKLYYLASATNSRVWYVGGSNCKLWGDITGRMSPTVNYCLGIRPVVELNEGIYIASGDGTESSPYILAKDNE